MNDANSITILLTKAREAFQQHEASQAYNYYLQIIDLDPANTSVLLEMGHVCATTGMHDAAGAAFQRVTELEPGNAAGYYMKGALDLMLGNYEQATSSLNRTLLLNPEYIDAHKDLGAAFYRLKKYSNAAEEYETYLKHKPADLSTIYNLGLTRKEQRQYENAELLFRKALSLSPDSAEIHNSLGHVLRQLNTPTAAEEHCRIAVKLKPGFADAHFTLGMALFSQLKLCDAERSMSQALKLDPKHKLAESSLACILAKQGEIEEAEQHYHLAVSLHNSASAHSNLLLDMHYRFHNSKDEIFNAHLAWSKKHITKSCDDYINNNVNKNPEKILRVGYLSANFRKHSVAYFLETIFRNSNPDSVEIYCYSDTKHHDVYTSIFKRYVSQWREVSSVSNKSLEKQIKQDNIDILVDLSGHTEKGHYRLALYALKPAPIQITYLGYPDTTGLSAMDYRVTDRLADPPGSEQWHSESLAYLETGFLCFTPPNTMPPVAPLPALNNKYITFGSFNSLAKNSPETLDAWRIILQRVPDSRILLKSETFVDNEMIERYRTYISSKGIDSSRVNMMGWTDTTEDHLSLYNEVDIALDPFPYNGTTTTCEALWMGVPVITLMGDRHCGRVGVSLLTSARLSNFIADSVNDYVNKAAELSSDIQLLNKLRASLRDKVEKSDLCNGEKFTRQLESCYRGMWHNWCTSI